MMRVKAVIDRLNAELVPQPFAKVSGLGELPDRLDLVKWKGAAFVMPKRDVVGPNTAGTALVEQQAMRIVSVLIGFTRMTARSMGDLDSVEDVVEEVKRTLIGWVPPGESAPVVYITGGVADQDLAQGILIWGCDFGCPYYLEA